MDILLSFFFDREKGGFYPYSSGGEQLLTRTKETYDGAMPSGNGAAALVLSRLARLTGEPRWREAADLQLSYLSWAAQEHPSGYSFTMLALLEELWPAGELVCTAREVPAELTSLLRRDPRPGLAVLVKTPETGPELADLAPFTREYPIPEGGPRYYLCRNGACMKPADSISTLISLLEAT